MKTYYIIEYRVCGDKAWKAHKRGILSTLGIFTYENHVDDSLSFTSADECEKKLRHILKEKDFKPTIIRVLEI